MKSRSVNISQFCRSIAGVLLLLFATYYTNITLFSHYHVVDGVTIVHSHIYSADHTANPEQSSHSKAELTLISLLSNFVVECQSSSITLESLVVAYHPVFADEALSHLISRGVDVTLLRGPPSNSILG